MLRLRSIDYQCDPRMTLASKRKRRKRRKRGGRRRKKVIPASRRKEWKTDGLAVGLDALGFVLAVTDGVQGGGDGLVEVHRKAWATGTRANDGASQPPLKPGGGAWKDARENNRPNLRGVTKEPRGLWEGPDVVSLRPRTPKPTTRSARATVTQPRRRPHLAAFLSQEADRGIEYLFNDGAVEADVDKNLDAWLDGLIE